MNKNILDKNTDIIWDNFSSMYKLSAKQIGQFKNYFLLLREWNEKINLTAITDLEGVIRSHFEDSVMIGTFIDFQSVKTICDVGTGGGFPGIPIKIVYPHLKLILVEVNHKKVRFLKQVIGVLGLEQVEVCDLDWRTFLRKTSYDVDIFCARASLRPEELIRAFSPVSEYQNSKIIYWASSKWEPPKGVEKFIENEGAYVINNKKRKFVFLRS